MKEMVCLWGILVFFIYVSLFISGKVRVGMYYFIFDIIIFFLVILWGKWEIIVFIWGLVE